MTESEKDYAIRLANRILEIPYGDQDDDLAVLSRQFLRALELQKFKDWVHSWLDGQGVPHDPYPDETKEHGCRVGGRMKWLVKNKFKE
jgi:hypothetical protein